MPGRSEPPLRAEPSISGWAPPTLEPSKRLGIRCGPGADRMELPARSRWQAKILAVKMRAPCCVTTGGVPCVNEEITSQPTAFEVTSKRRKGFPSETHVKRGVRIVGGHKQLVEKLGRNDPCPCRSGRRF